MVPANRIGSQGYSVAQLKILQERISLTLFVPFSLWYRGEPLRLKYPWAGLRMHGSGLLHIQA